MLRYQFWPGRGRSQGPRVDTLSHTLLSWAKAAVWGIEADAGALLHTIFYVFFKRRDHWALRSHMNCQKNLIAEFLEAKRRDSNKNQSETGQYKQRDNYSKNSTKQQIQISSFRSRND